ncbi:transglutaminaseTgpA domain-containing protein [Planosporangium sp. 12N6]|uniref:transglutaminase family protein n=1 Tax=Planosporangium spinosum TaxID=3402278 RepID=UPI003CF1A664
MNQRRHLTLVTAGATVLAALPLATVFTHWTWFVDALIVVITVSGVGLLMRTLRVAAWIPTVVMAAGFLFVLTWMFHSGGELVGVIPTPKTFAHFHSLLASAGQDMQDMGVPVADREGLLFLSTLGVGIVALLVDLLAVVVRRPALAGLPMLAIYSVPVAVSEESVSFLPFAAGAGGFMWLLATDNVDRIRRFGRRFTGDGRDVDAWAPSPLAATGRRLALVGVAVAIVVPLAVPGSTTGLLERFGPTGEGGGFGDGIGPGGRSQSVDMFAVLSGELNSNRTFDMVKVTTNDPNPYYLRFGVADEVSPAGFRSRTPGGGQPTTAGLPAPTVEPGVGVALHPYRAQVQILALKMNALPIYLQPTKTDKLDASWLYDRGNQIVYSRRSDSRDKRYGFEYVRPEFTPEALRTARPLEASDPLQRQYTTVPRNAEVDRIVTEVTAGKSTPYDKVRAIHSYFASDNGFTYSLRTKSGTSGSAIVDFLTNKQGFCEQYSAAMAWLVRAAGIPARVAFGFSRGNARTGDTWTLTNRNLHAWTEVYFEGFGWVPFDATPASYVGGVESAWAPDPNRPQSSSGDTPAASDLPIPGGPGPSGTTAPGDRRLDDRLDTGGSTGTTPAATSSWSVWGILGGLLVVVLLFAPALWRLLLRRRRAPHRIGGPAAVSVLAGSPDLVVTGDRDMDLARRRANVAWDELIDTMIDYRLPVDFASTPRATAERLITLAALDEWAATGARLLGQAEERARYARQPLRSDDLTGSLRTVREAIAHRVSWHTRIRAVVLPPSVVSRWRVAVTEASTRVTEAFQQRRDALVRALDVRGRLAGGRR